MMTAFNFQSIMDAIMFRPWPDRCLVVQMAQHQQRLAGLLLVCGVLISAVLRLALQKLDRHVLRGCHIGRISL